ncbi:hypothetical protein CYMTET_56634 [Cymbomonas tetramitiformis]|uniref:Sulfotransferase n=1 Tax=Cymbomonas tetramitiformis TaxID=36881 RepID=A0AAE0ELM5_9CHLO|nr:hypothetical protein CYMTET_56634 [Cymbomonas tetramitiformis]
MGTIRPTVVWTCVSTLLLGLGISQIISAGLLESNPTADGASDDVVCGSGRGSCDAGSPRAPLLDNCPMTVVSGDVRATVVTAATEPHCRAGDAPPIGGPPTRHHNNGARMCYNLPLKCLLKLFQPQQLCRVTFLKGREGMQTNNLPPLLGHQHLPLIAVPYSVALFRDPATRLSSAATHVMREPRTAKWHQRHDNVKLLSEHLQTVAAETAPLAYAMHPGVTGCQTRMLLGHSCVDRNWRATEADVVKAERRLTRLAFIGITEYFDASVCLWHAMYGGRAPRVAFHNMRPGIYPPPAPPRELVSEAEEQAVQGSPSTPKNMSAKESLTSRLQELDSADMRVYTFAKRIFLERLREYGVDEDGNCCKPLPL